MTLPTLQVLLDNGAGTFPYNITSKVMHDPGYSFSRGRDDEQAEVSAGSLTLTLNNSDGRFTPGSTVIASPSPIRVDQRIRVKETVNGVTYTRFTGYVKAWPVAWPATVPTFATVTITATDAQARAERRILRSVVEEEILADSPAAYYTLSEAAGSTSVADSSGQPWAGLLSTAGAGASVVLGNGIGSAYDGLTAAQFSAGMYLAGAALNNNLNAIAIEAEFVTSADGLIARVVTAADTLGEVITLDLSVVSGKVRLRRTSTSTTGDFTLTSATTVTDGLLHHAGAGVSGGNLVLGVDGTSEATATPFGTTPLSPQPATLYIGGAPGATGFTGTIAHVAVTEQATTFARMQAHASAALTGFAGESGTARLTRLAGYAGIPVGTLDTSLTNVAFRDITGTSAWSAIQDATDAEGGLTYVNGSGDLVFLNRDDAPGKVTPDLTIASAYVTPGPEPTQDDQQIVNYLEVTAEATGITQVVRDTTSELGDGTATHPGHGRYSDSKSYLVQTDAEALSRGAWLVNKQSEPSTRFGTLTVNLFKMTAAQAQAVVAALEPGCWLRVTGFPSQTPGSTTVDVVVQGITETANESEWAIACNVVSRSMFQAWVMGDPTFGVMGSTTILAP